MKTIDRLRDIFEAGDLQAAEIVPAPMEPGPKPLWVIQFRRRNGAFVGLCVARRDGGKPQERIFKSLDGAFSACQKIGFRGASVRLG